MEWKKKVKTNLKKNTNKKKIQYYICVRVYILEDRGRAYIYKYKIHAI